MGMFNVCAAKTRLSRLIDQALAGKEAIIVRAGKPVAKIVGLGKRRRSLGALAGRLKAPADLDAPLPAELRSAFEGGDEPPS